MPAAQIKDGMDFDAWRDAWFAIARERGHVLKEDKDFGGADQMSRGPPREKRPSLRER